MTVYTLQSAPMIHTPGIIRWLKEAVAPFDRKKALTILRETFGKELPLAARKQLHDGNYEVDGDAVIVTISK